MEAYHWFLFGIMVAWTPSLVILAVLLRKAKASYQKPDEKIQSLS